MKRWLGTVAIHLALGVGAVLTLLPLLWMLAASFMPTGAAAASPPRLALHSLTIEHYRELFTRLNLGRVTLNSALLALSVTAVSGLLNAMAGYAFAKARFAGRERLFRILLGALVIPAQVSTLPLFLMLKSLHLINTYWAVLIPGMASIFGIFLVRQYAMSVPDAVLDAGRIDGAGEFRIFRSVMVPLCLPVLVTLATFTFMGTWNDFMWPLVVLTDGSMYTLPVALANLVGEHVQDTELMMAGAVITVLPVLVLFMVLQRYYLAGIMAGGIKE